MQALDLAARPVTEIVVFVLGSVLWCGLAIFLAARPAKVFVVIVLDFVSWCGSKFSIPHKNLSLC